MAGQPSPSQQRVVPVMAEAGRPLRAADLPGGGDFRQRGGIVQTLKWLVRQQLAVEIPCDDPPDIAYELTEKGMQWYHDTFRPTS